MPYRNNSRPADRFDSEIRRALNRAVKQFNDGYYFVVDEAIAAIWNVSFAQYGAYKSDIDILKSLAMMAHYIGNINNHEIVKKELDILCGASEEGEEYIRPNLTVICSEDKRNEIRLNASRSDGYTKYLILFEDKYQYSRHFFHDIKPVKGNAILDVGTGAGFLPHILKYNGYDNVDAFDIPGASQGFDDSCRVLEVAKTEFTIEPQVSMKNFGQKYDIIACGMLQFDNNQRIKGDPWGIDDWLFFLKDVHDHHLLDDGFIYLGFNVARGEEVTSLFKDYEDENARSGNFNVKLTRENIRQCLS